MFNPMGPAASTLGMGAGLEALGVGMGPVGWAALAGANLLSGILGSNAEARRRQKEADIRAAEIEAQPWTKQAATSQITTKEPNMWANLVGSGLNVLSQGQALEKGMREAEAAKQNSQWKQMLMNRMGSMSQEDLNKLMLQSNAE